MLLSLLTAVLTAAPTAQDLIEGADFGTSDAYIAFASQGKYQAGKLDRTNGDTVLNGAWTVKGDTLEVKPERCKGPACPELDKPTRAKVSAAGDRTLLVKTLSADPLLPSGSYYCRYLGCEKRIGVELVARGAKVKAVNFVLDTLIDKNRDRNSTVVWVGKKAAAAVKQSRIEYCPREAERAKKGTEEAIADLAGLAWIGKLEATASTETDCLWDVRVHLADDLTPPAKVR